jgi:hypothetical protein
MERSGNPAQRGCRVLQKGFYKFYQLLLGSFDNFFFKILDGEL